MQIHGAGGPGKIVPTYGSKRVAFDCAGAEQEQLNKYLHTRDGAAWVTRVPYCSLQCTVDNGFWTMRQKHAAFLKRRKEDPNKTSSSAVLYGDWRYEVRVRVQRVVDEKVWILHTVGAKHVYFQSETGLPRSIEEMVLEAFHALSFDLHEKLGRVSVIASRSERHQATCDCLPRSCRLRTL